MKTSLHSDSISSARGKLTLANDEFARAYPGPPTDRQPIHVVYGGAHLFTSSTATSLSRGALESLNTYAPNGAALAHALDQDCTGENEALWDKIHSRVVEKLKREACEDFRIDFEDGYGIRPESEEDAHAQSTAVEVAKASKAGTLSPFIGIRIKPFNEENVARSIRTLDLFVTTLAHEMGGKLPSGFVVTLPKVTIAEQSHALALLLSDLETACKLPKGSLQFELMIETPQSVISKDGTSPIRAFVEAGKGRCIGAHFGTYDYTAGCSITAAHQAMSNPVCEFAKHVMQVSLAGMPVFLSDGATNIMPVGPHKGDHLTSAQKQENAAIVHRAWRISYKHIRHSLVTGFYQGWDLHPAQLPVRYAATYAFFLESLPQASQRLKIFVDKAAKATLLGDVFDDAATGQGLLNFFLRGMSCSAISEAEALNTGLTLDEFRSRSFTKILKGRTQ